VGPGKRKKKGISELGTFRTSDTILSLRKREGGGREKEPEVSLRPRFFFLPRRFDGRHVRHQDDRVLLHERQFCVPPPSYSPPSTYLPVPLLFPPSPLLALASPFVSRSSPEPWSLFSLCLSPCPSPLAPRPSPPPSPRPSSFVPRLPLPQSPCSPSYIPLPPSPAVSLPPVPPAHVFPPTCGVFFGSTFPCFGVEVARDGPS
jgi:hypothetical protein